MLKSKLRVLCFFNKQLNQNTLTSDSYYYSYYFCCFLIMFPCASLFSSRHLMISSKGFLHHPLSFLLCLHQPRHFPFPASHGQIHETHQPLPEGYGDRCFLLLRCSSSSQAGYGAFADAEALHKAAAAEHTTLRIEQPLETAESSAAVELLVAAADSVTLLLPEAIHH